MNASSAARSPLKWLRSQLPLIPSTLPVEECWKNAQLDQAAGRSGQMGPYWGIQSGWSANAVLLTWSFQKYLPL